MFTSASWLINLHKRTSQSAILITCLSHNIVSDTVNVTLDTVMGKIQFIHSPVCRSESQHFVPRGLFRTKSQVFVSTHTGDSEKKPLHSTWLKQGWVCNISNSGEIMLSKAECHSAGICSDIASNTSKPETAINDVLSNYHSRNQQWHAPSLSHFTHCQSIWHFCSFTLWTYLHCILPGWAGFCRRWFKPRFKPVRQKQVSASFCQCKFWC